VEEKERARLTVIINDALVVVLLWIDVSLSDRFSIYDESPFGSTRDGGSIFPVDSRRRGSRKGKKRRW